MQELGVETVDLHSPIGEERGEGIVGAAAVVDGGGGGEGEGGFGVEIEVEEERE